MHPIVSFAWEFFASHEDTNAKPAPDLRSVYIFPVTLSLCPGNFGRWMGENSPSVPVCFMYDRVYHVVALVEVEDPFRPWHPT